MPRLRRWGARIGLASLLLLAVLVAGTVGTVRGSFPQVSGELEVSGLEASVEVHRDGSGVPYLFAEDLSDLFRAQGYVHAQDRFWQMDFYRHIGEGRLAELFGEGELGTDRFIRTMGWRRAAQRDLEVLSDEALAALDAYAEGVNAWLDQNDDRTSRSLEYAILGLQNPDHEPEPWEPLDSATWLKIMAWDLSSQMEDEIDRALLARDLPIERVRSLYPPYPDRHPVIVEGGTVDDGRFVPPGATQAAALSEVAEAEGAVEVAGVAGAVGVPDAAAPQLRDLRQRLRQVARLLGATGSGVGSNSWVIDGSRTASGAPLLANDPHLAPAMPSIWYEMSIRCEPCGFGAAGFGFAGVPGIVVGHNDRIAWGVTNLGPDVQDLYIEKLDPEDPDRYEFEGGWQRMDIREEQIPVAGAGPVTLRIRSTVHGPVMSDVSEDLRSLDGSEVVETPQPYAVALRWTALDANRTLDAVLGFNRATDHASFREAAALFDVPAQNLVYADVDGTIAYQAPGRIPIRERGDGTLPVPGWTGEHEWTGFIPFEALPWVVDPADGYVVTANNAVVRDDHPHLLASNFDRGYRAERIVEMIEQAGDGLTVEDMQRMQLDAHNPFAPFLVPALLDLDVGDERVTRAMSLLEDWDGQDTTDSAAGAFVNATWRHLLAATFHDELPEDQRPEAGDRAIEVVRVLLDRPDDPWWDDVTTEGRETRDDVLTTAAEAAVDELTERSGDDPAGWRWGDLHDLTIEHESLGRSGIAPIEWLFNRGPYRLPGGEDHVNATGWTPTAGYTVDWVPSMRMVVDLSDLDATTAIHLTGTSGHAFHPNYDDMAPLWADGETLPLPWSRGAVEDTSQSLLRLIPAG